MNRFQHLLSLGSSLVGGAGLSTSSVALAADPECRQSPNAASFRWLVPVAEYRVGVLAKTGSFVLSHENGNRTVIVNIPRATRSDTGWRDASAPAEPYATKSQIITDVITYGGPDFVTAAAAVNFEAVFGMGNPIGPVANYLVRITPRTRAMQVLALPMDSHGAALGLYKTPSQEKLTIVRQDGTTTTVDYPPTI